MEKPLYFDYLATTPTELTVIEKMVDVMRVDGTFGNPSSHYHSYGWQAKALVDNAAEQVADLLHCMPEEIIWTSGATEANNLALKGAAQSYQHRGRHIITVASEHKAILEPCAELEKQGFSITYLKPQANGLVALEDLQQALCDDTILVSIMWVNNETGVIQDMSAIAAWTRAEGILLHVDAAQAVGKIAIDLATTPIDLLSLSAHKFYGPKGAGALFCRRRPRVRLQCQIHGGGQQQGMRGGTLATPLICGMGEAAAIAKQRLSADYQQAVQLRQHLWQQLQSISAVYLNASFEHTIPHVINLSFLHVEGEALLMSLPQLALSSGSACNSMLTESSHVLRAMGFDEARAANALRISFGRQTTLLEIQQAAYLVTQQVERLRSISPVWESSDAV